MILKQFVFNPLQENTYVLHTNDNYAIIIDPGNYSVQEDNELFEYLDNRNIKKIQILLTHAHIDHVAGVSAIKNNYVNTKIGLHKLDYNIYLLQKDTAQLFGFNPLSINDIDIYLDKLPSIKIGVIELSILFTPGHAPGHVSFLHKESNSLFSGDVLFKSGVGRTDLPGGDYNTLMETIKNTLYQLPEDTIIYCGHGEKTLIKDEKVSNPYVHI